MSFPLLSPPEPAGSWLARVTRVVEAATTPLLPADYLDLFAPLRSGADLRGRIVSVEPETRDAATLVIKPGADWAGHVPGQYVRIGVDVDGVRQWRAYSLTHGPRRDGRSRFQLVADDEGLFAKEGIKIEWIDRESHVDKSPTLHITDHRDASRFASHGSQLEQGKADLYNACEWGNYSRVETTKVSSCQIGRRSIVTYAAIVVRPDSDVQTPQQLAGKLIGLPYYNGTHYLALQMLEGFIPRELIKTGRLPNGLRLGLFEAVTGRGTGTQDRTMEPTTNYTAIRAQQDFRRGESGVGLMLTGVNRRLDEWTEGRRRNAERYQRLFTQAQLLDRVLLPVTAAGNFHVYNQYTVRVRQRDELRNFLKEKGVQFKDGEYYGSLRFVHIISEAKRDEVLILYLERLEEADIPLDVVARSRQSGEWPAFCEKFLARALRSFTVCED